MGSICVLVCFLQGVGGAVQYPKNYLKEAYKLVRERGGVCIADEVQVSLCILMNNFGRIIINSTLNLNCEGLHLVCLPVIISPVHARPCFIKHWCSQGLIQKLLLREKLQIIFLLSFVNRSRLGLAEQEATSGVSKVTMSFPIWSPWQRALEMDSQWELLSPHQVVLQ